MHLAAALRALCVARELRARAVRARGHGRAVIGGFDRAMARHVARGARRVAKPIAQRDRDGVPLGRLGLRQGGPGAGARGVGGGARRSAGRPHGGAGGRARRPRVAGVVGEPPAEADISREPDADACHR